MSQPQLKPGMVLFTEGSTAYEFMMEVVGGPYGERVLLARRRTPEGPDATVFLKCVHMPTRPSSQTQQAHARLEEEMRLMEYLRHPGIARVHGLRQVQNTFYAIAECVEGNSLDTLVNVVPEHFLRYSESFVLYVGAQVAQALAYAHACRDTQGQPLGIVHRAVDFTRIWVTWSGQVKLTDFGLAFSQLAGRLPSSGRRLRGEPYALSPEALLGLPVDARSDLFQLGMVLYELATGTHPLDPPRSVPLQVDRPFTAEEQARIKASLKRAKAAGMEPSVKDVILRSATFTARDLEPLAANLSQPLRGPILRLLQPEPAARYLTAHEAELALRASLDQLGAYGDREAARELSETLAEAGARLVAQGGGFAPMAAVRESPDAAAAR
jgi:serine/threonine-protein kinase